jgi:RNA polymerase sigma factor for flagellar operon FliA
MLDEIRRTDWTPRSVHRKAREVAEAVRRIENREGRDARDVEVAEEMGIGLDEYHKILQDATGCRIFSFEDPASLGEEGFTSTERQSNQPYENLQKENFKAGLAEAIKGLPERERLVMALYYDEELNLREIGEILGVSESRVCQIHGQSLIRLRARMEDWLKD